MIPALLKANFHILSDVEKELAMMLLSQNQHHLFVQWEPPGNNDDAKHSFFAQIKKLHESYSVDGGLAAYLTQARRLLADAREGKNPLEGWHPTVPHGIELGTPGTPAYLERERLGLAEVGKTGFVLVAGGLGERLGYNGIKVQLPTESTTGCCYLDLYCRQILAMQSRYGGGKKLPFAIMVSDDTLEKTLSLLTRHDYFGLERDQVTVMKQEKVAALMTNAAHIALARPYEVDSKPHGHGDVHSLMYSTGTASRWQAAGIEWCAFFQDTNALAFLPLPAMLGVSKQLGLEVNSLAIPRFAKQAVGAITKLVHDDGREMTVNVEYNQLDPLLRATGSPDGDVNDATGHSPYPGNINQLVFAIGPYVQTLAKTSGVMGEFVNPKYTDATKTKFQKPTRLECMMQDYPKVVIH